MKAVVFKDVGDIRLQEVARPTIKDENDAIVKLTASAICGTDLHMVRGTMPGMKSGTILGHEGVGIVKKLGKNVRNLNVGDRVVIPSTIACGYCVYCRDGIFSQCDNANPNGKEKGTAFFGGPKDTGPFDGMQAEEVRVPYANVGLVKIPDNVTDDQAILLSDIFPTAYFGAEMADVCDGKIVVVFGCGPVGLFAILSSQLLGAGRVIAVDRVPGLDAECSSRWLSQAKEKISGKEKMHKEQVKKIAPKQNRKGDLWVPGDAPTQVLEWAVDAVAKAGTISIIGVYSEKVDNFPLGKAMNKNLTIRMGNCNHRKYIPYLLELVASGAVDPLKILTKQEPLYSAIDAFKAFDKREPGWIKVELDPAKAEEQED